MAARHGMAWRWYAFGESLAVAHLQFSTSPAAKPVRNGMRQVSGPSTVLRVVS
jgi:hypothetical protein